MARTPAQISKIVKNQTKYGKIVRSKPRQDYKAKKGNQRSPEQ